MPIDGGHDVTHRVRLVARHAPLLQQVFGVLVALSAPAIYLQYDALAYARIITLFSSLQGL
jgi:hypothetical protein